MSLARLRRRYDPLSHRYFVGDMELPSVTQVLVRAGRIDTRWYSPEAADRGRLVHRVCEIIDRQRQEADAGIWTRQLDRWAIEHPDLHGFAEAYLCFTREYRPDYYAIEQPRWSLRYRFAGRPDRCARSLRGIKGRAIVEIKSGPPAPWHGLQTAGYQLLKGNGARCMLYLQPNGRYKFQRQTGITDYLQFRRDLEGVWRQIDHEQAAQDAS